METWLCVIAAALLLALLVKLLLRYLFPADTQ